MSGEGSAKPYNVSTGPFQEGIMNEDALNMSVQRFLKNVGVTSQREILAPNNWTDAFPSLSPIPAEFHDFYCVNVGQTVRRVPRGGSKRFTFTPD
jgi:hypothetical protein